MAPTPYEVRSDLSVSITPQGGQVVQASTGKALAISADEAWVLQTLQGANGIVEAVVELGQRQRPPLPPARVEAIVQRMAELTILVKRGQNVAAPRPSAPSVVPAAPVGAAPPGGSGVWSQLDPAEVLPAFRSDLKLRKKAKGLFEVVDEQAGKAFSVYDFEVSLARLMNGRRTAAEVVENGSRLGIPVTLDTLKKFVRQLTAYGFLAPVEPVPDAPPAPEGGSWEPREEWDPGVRQLFQSGIRLLNQGRTEDAKGYFQALIELDPQHVEALEQLAALDGQGPASKPEEAPATRVAPEPSRRVWLAVGAALALSLAGMSVGLVVLWRTSGPPPVPTTPVPTTPTTVPEPTTATPPVAIAAVEAGRPTTPVAAPWTASGSAAHHPELSPLMASAKGTLHWSNGSGDAVERGAPVATIRATSAASTKAVAQSKRKLAELEALAEADPVYRDFVVRERAKLKRLQRAKGKEVPVLSPATGTLQLGPQVDEVEVGQRLGQVVDAARWVLTVDGATAPPATETRCVVEGASPEQRAPCTVVAREGLRLVVELTSAAAPWFDAGRSVRVRLDP